VIDEAVLEGFGGGEPPVAVGIGLDALDRLAGELSVEPSLGRALIQDALLRYLLKVDYQLEPGGDYVFTVRARF
jgi:hypothetical protein